MDEFVLEESAEHHAGQQPLGKLTPCSPPEVHTIHVSGYRLAGHLHYLPSAQPVARHTLQCSGTGGGRGRFT